jgi:hypothetical protein
VNTAYRKTSLHRDKPNLELAVSELTDPGPRSPRPVLANEREHAWEGSWMTRIDPASWAYPFFTMSRKPPLKGAAKRYSSCLDVIFKALWALLPASIFGANPGSGGARRDRTDDLLLAKQALSQLSYGPVSSQFSQVRASQSGARHQEIGGPGKI